MAEKKKELTFVVRAKDAASAILKGLGSTLRGLTGVVRGVGGVFSLVFRGIKAAITAPISLVQKLLGSILNLKTVLAGVFASSVIKTFADFEAGINQVATLVDTTVVNMDELSDGVRRVGVESGQSFDDLNEALFNAISAGVDAGESIGFMADATKLAAAGGTEINNAVAGLTSIMNAYNLETEQAAEVSDALFVAMKKGVTTIGEMSSSLGRVSSIANAAGLSVEEMTAAVAALTKGGLSTDEAVTRLIGVLNGVIKPQEAAIQMADRLGIEFSTAGIRAQGFGKWLEDLGQKTMGSDWILGQLFGNIRGLGGALNLLNNDGQAFKEIMDDMADKAGIVGREFNKVSGQLKTEVARGFRAAEDAMIGLGEALAPVVRDMVSGLKDFTFWVANNQQRIEIFVEIVRDSVGTMVEILKDGFKEKGFVTVFAELMAFFARSFAALFVDLAPVMLSGGKLLGASFVTGLFDSITGGSREHFRDQFLKFLVNPDDFAWIEKEWLEKVGKKFMTDADIKLVEHVADRLNVIPAQLEKTTAYYQDAVRRTLSELWPKMNVDGFIEKVGGFDEAAEYVRHFLKVTGRTEELDTFTQKLALFIKMNKDWQTEMSDLRASIKSGPEDSADLLDPLIKEFEQNIAKAGTEVPKTLAREGERAIERIAGVQGLEKFEALRERIGVLWKELENEPTTGLLPLEFIKQGAADLAGGVATKQFQDAFRSIGGKITESIADGLEAANQADLVGALRDMGTRGAAAMADAFKKGKEITEAAEKAALEATLKTEQVMKDFDALKGELIQRADLAVATGADRLKKMVELRVTQALNDANDLLQQFPSAVRGEKIEELRTLLTEAFTKELAPGVREARQEVDLFGRTMDSFGKSAISTFSSGVADAMVDLALSLKTAEEAWQSFANVLIQILKQMIAALIQFALLKTLFTAPAGPAGLVSNATGVVPSAMGNVLKGGFKAFASGAPRITEPTLGLVGEGKYNEAIVPLPDGRSIPVQMMGGGNRGGGGNITVVIPINAVDAPGVSRLLLSQEGVLKQIIREAVRSDGDFARELGQRVRKGV